MLTLYDFMGSGNGYKVRLLLAQLGLPYKLVECDILKGETRTPEFLAKNPNGRIPTLQLEDGTHLAESDAILWYLAEGTTLAPADRLARARRCNGCSSSSTATSPSSPRCASGSTSSTKLTPLQEMELPGRMEKGYAALGVMEQHLAHHQYFVGDRYGLADIALYAYTHVAQRGQLQSRQLSAVNAWLARVAAQPGHVTIDHKN